MIVSALDKNGDWTFGSGLQGYLSGNQAIGQCVQTRIKSFKGDCFFDANAWVDWWNLLGSKNPIGTDLAVRTCIVGTTGVTKIVEVSNNLDQNRSLTVSYRVYTVYSVLTGNVGVLNNA